MKKVLSLLAVGFLGVEILTSICAAQTQSKASTIPVLQVTLQKFEYLLLEPVAVEFRLTQPRTDYSYSITRAVSVKVDHAGVSREYHQLTWYIDDSGTPPSFMPLKKIPEARPDADAITGVVERKEGEIIDRAEELFPEAGEYQIQFFIPQTDGSVICSNMITLFIKDPVGMDKEAWTFLAKYQKALSFDWVWAVKDGFSLLERFVAEYGNSVYGDLAVQYLGQRYIGLGETEKARIEFEKLRTSVNPIIRTNAVKTLSRLAETDRNQTDIKRH